MAKFKVGDKVRFMPHGDTGEVREVKGNKYKVYSVYFGVGGDDYTRWFNEGDLSPYQEFKRGSKVLVDGAKRAEVVDSGIFRVVVRYEGGGRTEEVVPSRLRLLNSAACNASSSRNPVVANAVAWACGKVACNASPDGDERSMALVKENLVKLSHFIDDAYETARESQKTREMIEYVVSRMSPDGKAAAAKEIRNTLSAFQREISFMAGPWYRVKA